MRGQPYRIPRFRPPKCDLPWRLILFAWASWAIIYGLACLALAVFTR